MRASTAIPGTAARRLAGVPGSAYEAVCAALDVPPIEPAASSGGWRTGTPHILPSVLVRSNATRCERRRTAGGAGRPSDSGFPRFSPAAETSGLREWMAADRRIAG